MHWEWKINESSYLRKKTLKATYSTGQIFSKGFHVVKNKFMFDYFSPPRLLRILATFEAKIAKTCNSANNPSFLNLTKSLFAQRSLDVKSAVTY